jgi:hypothetical protein
MRFGFTFLGRDLEFFPCANIALLRTEYTQAQLDTGAPIVPFVSKAMEFAMQVPEVSGIFLLMLDQTALFIEQIVRKFPGSIDGIVLVNPMWYAPPQAPFPSLEDKNAPKDVPLLIIGTGLDQFQEPEEFARWRAAGERVGAEVVFYDSCDHYLVGCEQRPFPQEYFMVEKHMSDVPLRKIAQWIRQQAARA